MSLVGDFYKKEKGAKWDDYKLHRQQVDFFQKLYLRHIYDETMNRMVTWIIKFHTKKAKEIQDELYPKSKDSEGRIRYKLAGD